MSLVGVDFGQARVVRFDHVDAVGNGWILRARPVDKDGSHPGSEDEQPGNDGKTAADEATL